MKKLFALLLALVMMFSLVACVQGDVENTKGTDGTKDTQATSPSFQTQPSEDTLPTGEDLSKRYGGTFYMSWKTNDHFDPMQSTAWSMGIWKQNVWENLITRDAGGELAPGVCDFEISDDRLTLKLWVREGVTFHNGDPVDIHDCKASFDRSTQLIKRIKNHVVPYLVSAEVSENKYLTIKFSEYDATTLQYLANLGAYVVAMPKEICEKYGTELVTDINDAIGTGPYTLDPTSPMVSKVILKRYENYVPVPEGRTGCAAPKMAYFDQIVMTAYDDASIAYMAFINGELDMISYDPEMISMLEGKEVKYYQDYTKGMTTFCFNCKNPNVPSYDKNIRKAIAAAMDYNTVLEFRFGGFEYDTDVSPMVEGSPYYCEAYAAADYHGAANIELAKKYLAAANYNGEEVICLMDQGSDYFPIVEQCLKAAGINVKAMYMDSTALDSYIMDDANNAYDFSIQPMNVTDYLPNNIPPNFMTNHWDSEERDELLPLVAQNPFGSEASVNAWKEIDKLLADECPAISFGNCASSIYVTDDVVLNFQSYRYFYNSYFEDPSKH